MNSSGGVQALTSFYAQVKSKEQTQEQTLIAEINIYVSQMDEYLRFLVSSSYTKCVISDPITVSLPWSIKLGRNN